MGRRPRVYRRRLGATLVVAMIAGLIGHTAVAETVVTVTCEDTVYRSDEQPMQARHLVEHDGGFVSVHPDPGGGALMLAGHAPDGRPAPIVGGQRERRVTFTGEARASYITAGRVLVVTFADGRDRVLAYDLDGNRIDGFGNNGVLQFALDRYLAGVVQRSSGGLVFWLESVDFDDDVRELVLTTADGRSPHTVTLDPGLASGPERPFAFAPSGDGHVYALISENDFGSTTRVERVRLDNGTADSGFAVDDTFDPVEIADLGGRLLAAQEDGVVRVYGTSGARVTSFGNNGQVDLGEILPSITTVSRPSGGRIAIAGLADTSPEKFGAVLLDVGGRVSGVGKTGWFGAPEADLDQQVSSAAVLPDGVLLALGDGYDNAAQLVPFGPDGGLLTDCGSWTKLRVVRHSGNDRYATAAAVVRAGFPTADTVMIATGADFPDALTGGAAAAAVDAPLLLTTKDEVPVPTRGELDRLRPSRIFVLGGPNSVSDRVVASLGSLPWDPKVERLHGKDRYATALAVSARIFAAGVFEVHLVTGSGFADALAAVPPAARSGGPILLVPGSTLTDALRAELRRLDAEMVTIAGGPNSVSYEFEDELAAGGFVVNRFGGIDRYQTAAMLHTAMPYDSHAVFLASGEGFADALAAGPVAARRHAPLLLTPGGALPEQARDAMSERGVRVVHVTGGPKTVADSVLGNLTAANLGYVFFGYQDFFSRKLPMMWDACKAIPWRWYPSDGQPSDLDFFKAGLAAASQQTGVTFTYLGTTSTRPTSIDGSEGHVVIGMDDAVNDQPSDVMGVGGPTGSVPYYTGGMIAIRPSLSGEPFDGMNEASKVLVHEAGHLLGLDHVGSEGQLMHLTTSIHAAAKFQAGDLAGLERTLDFSACR